MIVIQYLLIATTVISSVVLLILILVFRPQGLLGAKVVDRA